MRYSPPRSSPRFGWRNTANKVILIVLTTFGAHEFAIAQAFQWHTRDAGLGTVAGTNGVALADYDGDGDVDVYFVVHASYKSNDSKTWNRLFANQGDGTFRDVTVAAGLAGKNSNTIGNPSGMGDKMGAAWGDYDNDGWPDIFLTHFGPNQLFHNNGDGTFTEVTQQAGVAGSQTHLSSSALWFDYDRDGDLDLYVSNWENFSTYNRDATNWMYENSGNGVFLDVSATSGLADKGKTWMSVAIDANNDGHLDLYLANDFGHNRFYLNNGDKTFQEKTAEFGLEDRFHGMGMAITDCDGNGYFDIYLTNITENGFDAEINPLFLNTGQGYFINASAAAGVSLAGWGWGTEFFDLENDGDDDLFVATGYFLPEFPNVLFRNESDSNAVRFENISSEFGLADSTVARGLVVFDYDDDGDSDLLISNFTETPSLYENLLPQGNWLKIKLEGTVSNRDAIGAVVEVVADGKTLRKFHHGAQFLAQNLLPLHFGLGEAKAIERITVRWPLSHIDEIGPLPANQTILIRERSGIVSGVSGTAHNHMATPKKLRLLGNYPNPFNGTTRIRFELSIAGEVEVRILSANGQTLQVIKQFFGSLGEHAIDWNTTELDINSVSSGLYFYKVTVNSITGHETGKMLYIK